MGHALVTGSSRGMGRAIAQTLARRGDRVVVHFGRDRDAAEQTLASLDGSGHALVGGDIGDPETAQRLVAEAIDAVGHLDILVNNAAVAPTAANEHRVDSTSFAQWQRAWSEMVAVNLLGASNVSMLVAQHMIARGQGGSIVNVGSRGAFRGEADHPAYAATKSGLQALGQSLALALAPHGISVTSVAPGMIATERQAAKLDSAEGDSIRGQRAPSVAWAPPKRWRMPSPTSPRRGRSGRPGRSSTSTAPRTSADAPVAARYCLRTESNSPGKSSSRSSRRSVSIRRRPFGSLRMTPASRSTFMKWDFVDLGRSGSVAWHDAMSSGPSAS
ncbi:SDR family NAD(P)-dependent oxidoreductase [Microbacterium sp. 3J1]|uniref:SDR family NAD(P)-dependent oxidoreductase n=1 Tax=Microbacterium sp. 3J1 TaxID=861269 RepID=UPI000AABA757|nr:SDR family oxidoreductase [Microbacterium sp. 3J1]